VNTMKQVRCWAVSLAALTTAVCGTPLAWAGEHLPQPATDAGSATAPAALHDGDASGHRWDIRSSVQVPREAIRDALEASRQAYAEKLQKYAKLSARDAEKAAAAAHPGMKIETVQLRTLRTNLVYVTVAQDDENRYLVLVDPGNGKVLLDKPLPTHHERVFADR
jgi:uncharacterized iron-regulated membrane protein